MIYQFCCYCKLCNSIFISFLVYRKTINFCILTLYSVTMLCLFIYFLGSILWDFLHRQSHHLWTQIFFFCFSCVWRKHCISDFEAHIDSILHQRLNVASGETYFLSFAGVGPKNRNQSSYERGGMKGGISERSALQWCNVNVFIEILPWE